MRRSRCKSCGRYIIWAKSETTGRMMPVDAEPSAEGTFVLLGFEDPPIAAKPDGSGDPLAAATARHTSHFATCPDADQHRKRGQTRGGLPHPMPPGRTRSS